MGGGPTEGPDFADEVRQPVAAVGRKVLRDADGGKEVRVGVGNFLRRRGIVEFTDQARDALGDERIGVATEATDAGLEGRHQP